MSGGFAVTKEPGTDLFARRFNEAGFGVLAFDYRNIGESGGQPRQVQRVFARVAGTGRRIVPGASRDGRKAFGRVETDCGGV